jgi:hypothetical protein
MFLHTGTLTKMRGIVCRICGVECKDGDSYSDHIQAKHLEQCSFMCDVSLFF